MLRRNVMYVIAVRLPGCAWPVYTWGNQGITHLTTNISILNQLAGLSATELDEVIKHAKGLKQFAAATPQLAAIGNPSLKRGTDEYDWILGECANVCRAKG